MTAPLYVGIDLGTTNSSAAAFDGADLTVVRNGAGSSLTPSVVRVSAKGGVTVGEKARRFLDTDPDNTRTGFKRLMGTDTTLRFPAADRALSPEALSAEVLKSIAHDCEVQLGVRPTSAVITVPALFELPQTRATSAAAKLAGFDRVELLQEPVASALAAGFKSGSDGRWLVYDLGGGTFDVSLLEGRDGLLRVVGHDGDNFLGGRDFDAAIVNWAIELLAADGIVVDLKNPAHQPFLRRLAALAEEAKIELGRQQEVVLTSGTPLRLGDRDIEVELPLSRAILERLVTPLVERSTEVCRRLLDAHGVDRADLDRVVLVGGPTAMPFVRGIVAERVGPLAAEALDPMTLVAQGAALAAAQSGLDARSTSSSMALATTVRSGHSVQVKVPTLSTDLLPFAIVKLVDGAAANAPTSLRIVRGGEGAAPGAVSWASEWVARDADGAFAVMCELESRRANQFTIEAKDAGGLVVAVHPAVFTIVHGVTIGDPPVSRTVGVALANNGVRVYFEKGAPLPAKRTFVHHTIETVMPGQAGPALRIPLVQGELEEAHLCRLIGSLDIDGKDLDVVVPANTAVEVTLELDKGGQLSARAFIPTLKKMFEHVAHLVVPEASVATLRTGVVQVLDRLAALRAGARARGQTSLADRVDGLLREQHECEVALDRASGGDEEAAQRARRLLLDLETRVQEMEAEGRWPELEERVLDDVAWAAPLVAHDGTPAEQKLMDDAIGGINRARQNRSVKDLERHRRVVRRLGNAAFFRDPQAWVVVFDNYASTIHEARDLKRAEALVAEGRRHTKNGDHKLLRGVCDQLAELMPVSAQDRARAYASGLR
jgi:molecular chaperone DnaK